MPKRSTKRRVAPPIQKSKGSSKMPTNGRPTALAELARSELFPEVLRFCTDRTLARCMRVSKAFFALASPVLYRDLTFSDEPGPFQALYFHKSPSVTDLYDEFEDEYDTFGEDLRGLRSYELFEKDDPRHYRDYEEDNWFVKKFEPEGYTSAAGLRHMRTLHIDPHDCGCPNMEKQWCPKLKTVCVDFAPTPEFHNCTRDEGWCSLLTSLHFDTLVVRRLAAPWADGSFSISAPKSVSTIFLDFETVEGEYQDHRREYEKWPMYEGLPDSVPHVVFHYPLGDRLANAVPVKGSRGERYIDATKEEDYDEWFSGLGVAEWDKPKTTEFSPELLVRQFAQALTYGPKRRYTMLDVQSWNPKFCGVPNASPETVQETVKNAITAEIEHHLAQEGQTEPEIADRLERISYFPLETYLRTERPDPRRYVEEE